MQDMRQLERMGLMAPGQVKIFQDLIDASPPVEALKNIRRLIDPVKDEEGLRNIAARLNTEFSQVPKHRKEPLPKNKAKRQRAKA